MLAWLGTLAVAQWCAAVEADVLATITLQNPTGSHRPALVEVPTGRIGGPALIDWSAVRLMHGQEEVPFGIRDGQAHWKATLAAPASPPRPEDLLCFVATVPPGETLRFRIVPGPPAAASAITRQDSQLVVAYPAITATIDESTGCLTALSVSGIPLIDQPLSITFQTLATPGYATTGAVGPGFHTMTVQTQPTAAVPYQARLTGQTSSGAMTELHWLLEPEEGPAMGLTYRVYASGMLEIVADERPWSGASPWVDRAVAWSLSIPGESAPLPLFETRWPFYGFKDYAAAFQQTGLLWNNWRAQVAELGEEAANGRRWRRVLLPAIGTDARELEDWIELYDEGLVVSISPVSTPLGRVNKVVAPPEAEAIAVTLRDILGQNRATESAAVETVVRLSLAADPQTQGLQGDGFLIQKTEDGIEIVAGTRLGLHQAVRAIADHLLLNGPDAGIPLIASNPVVAFRAGGFGGGNFEVDFPYADVAEWERVLGEMLDSGMNVFTCLGMWGNWKMPVRYTYMPELYSDDPEAYDESTGVLFSETEAHRDHALHLLRYVQDRGGKVWLWLPIGCVPTTFAAAHPEAMMPGHVEEFWGRPKGIPCFTHPIYLQYLDALLRELVETYPIDGLMLVRDDNGGLCTCDRCRAFLETSRTGQGAWEQYLVIYDTLRGLGFEGAIGVYPYFDAYTAQLENQLPKDLYIVGHGASLAGLTRSHELVGHMPDTWLDNLYANFRLPSAPRMRRLLADRATFTIGGAYSGTELPWLSIGHFGWDPASTPNTLRHLWAARRFGLASADAFVSFSDAYEHLWEIQARWMSPKIWMDLSEEQRTRVVEEAETGLARCREALDRLMPAVSQADPRWSAHVALFPLFFEYHLQRLLHFSMMYSIVTEHQEAVTNLTGLPEPARQQVLDHYAEIYRHGERYAAAARQVPGNMMEATRHMLAPYKEWMAGYDAWIDPSLALPQFAGSITVSPSTLAAGQPFTLRVDIANKGICPWIAEAEQKIELLGEVEQLGLPPSLAYAGQPVASGEKGSLELTGTAPATPGEAEITIKFNNPYRATGVIAEHTLVLVWN